MGSTPSYQLRHSIMHLHKVLGNVATLTEQSFHRESINEAALDLAERRLPDLQAFILKIASLAGINLQRDFAALGANLQEAQSRLRSPAADLAWLETLLVNLANATAMLGKHHGALMATDTVPRQMRSTIRTALHSLQQTALQLADYLQVDLERNYRDRLLAVEHRKLA